MSEWTGPYAPLAGPVPLDEFRERFAEMMDRVLAGEEIVVSRGTVPIARLTPIESRPPKRLGVSKDFLSEEERRALREVMEAPLSDADQRVLEGEGNDDVGVWIGLPEDRDPS